jgi:hypothetical protein
MSLWAELSADIWPTHSPDFNACEFSSGIVWDKNSNPKHKLKENRLPS